MDKQIITAQVIVKLIKDKFAVALEDVTISGIDDEKPILEQLNIRWFDRKLRLESNAKWYEGIKKSLNKTYADVTINNEAITFSTDIDQKSIDCLIEFITPSDNIKILEYASTIVKLKNVGKAIDLALGEKNTPNYKEYTVFLTLGSLAAGDVITTALGAESMIASMSCNISIMPKIATYNDYKVSFAFENNEDGAPVWLDTPLNEMSFDKSANQKNVPYQNAKLVGTRNISASTLWGISFWALNTVLSEKVTTILLDDNYDMDAPFQMKITYKKGVPFIYRVKFATLTQKLTNNDYVLTSATLSRHSAAPEVNLQAVLKMARGGQNG